MHRWFWKCGTLFFFAGKLHNGPPRNIPRNGPLCSLPKTKKIMSLIFKIRGALVFLCPFATRGYCKPFQEPRNRFQPPAHRSFADPYGDIWYVEKTPRKFQFGKKSAKGYHSLYSSTEQLQVALWTFMSIRLGWNNEKSIHTLPLLSLHLLSLPL